MGNKFTSYLNTPIGQLEVSGNENLVTTISFMEKEIAYDIFTELPYHVQQCKNQLDQYFSGNLIEFDFPFLQPGTDFQKKVWQKLIQIKYGKTISYLDLAKQMKDANATRAVANANGRNNLAIVVPCHRVIGSDGTLTGYAGGLWRKKWLLEHENKVAHGVQVLF